MKVKRRVVLSFPMPPNLANSRMHWRVKHKEKRAYWDALDLRAFTGELPSGAIPPFSRVALSSTMTLWAPMDDDNAMARHKWVLDWLTKRMFWLDDSRKTVRWKNVPKQVISRKVPSSITLTLEEQ